MILPRIAVLSITKHPRRTLLIVFAIMLSVMVMLFVEGMLDGMRRTFFQRTLRDTGHIQLHDAGWEDRINQYSLEYTIPEPEALLSELRAREDVLDAEKFLLFGGMLISEGKNLSTGGVGVPPETYAKLAPYEHEMADLCGVSRFTLDENGEETIGIEDISNEPRCERSWKRDGTVKQRSDGGWLTDRDAEAVGVE